jgi:hypothetical protein
MGRQGKINHFSIYAHTSRVKDFFIFLIQEIISLEEKVATNIISKRDTALNFRDVFHNCHKMRRQKKSTIFLSINRLSRVKSGW